MLIDKKRPMKRSEASPRGYVPVQKYSEIHSGKTSE